MNANDRLRAAADSTLEERLRAAGNALREGSALQVDAATGLREIVHGIGAAADHQPGGQAAAAGRPPGPPTRRWFPSPQRLALVVNLLLVVALSVLLLSVARDRRQPVSAATVTTAATVQPVVTVPRTTVTVPQECLDAAELADEVIARLNRGQRDAKVALALRDYSVASQACRREAAAP